MSYAAASHKVVISGSSQRLAVVSCSDEGSQTTLFLVKPQNKWFR